MLLNKRNLLKVFAFSIIAIDASCSQVSIDGFRNLVGTSAQRLLMAKPVALAKWDYGTAVEDPQREAQVIIGATKAAESRGLDPVFVSSFFRAQIEANKVVQYSLLANWRRTGRAPEHVRVDLANTIRPQLDQIQGQLLEELKDTALIRASASCQVDLARAVGEYARLHEEEIRPLYAIALDRALAASCSFRH